MDEYRYSKLHGDEVRLVRLLPGGFDEDIIIRIEKSKLKGGESLKELSTSRRMGVRELKETLPPGWWVYETIDGDIYFYYEEYGGKNWKTSWNHPDPAFDSSLYQIHETDQGAIDGPSYEALSYTWGSGIPSDVAFVPNEDGKTKSMSKIEIGGNLACALRHLRQEDSERTLWIDAICIDQSSLSERGEQVARMAHIYKNAHRVIVWLGEEANDSNLAMKTLRYLADQVVLTVDNWLFSTPGAAEPYWCESTCALPYRGTEGEAINHLINRPWFGRIWIIQEIQMANKDAMIQCGNEQLTWSAFRTAVSCIWIKNNLPSELSRESLTSVEYLANTPYREAPMSHILRLIKGRKCKEKHDYVYGVLGLLPQSLHEFIRPDYSLSATQVYLDLVVSCIRTEACLALLRDCHHISRARNNDLPSWVPDFSTSDTWLKPIEWQHAAGDSRAVFRFPGPNLLEVTGVQCGTVKSTESFEYNDNSRRASGLFNLPQFPRGDPESPFIFTGVTKLDVYAKTLATGFLRDRFPDERLMTSEEWRIHVVNQTNTGRILDGLYDDATPSFQSHWAAGQVMGRVLFQTDKGYIGLGPSGTKPDDIVVVLLGCDSPILLRTVADNRHIVVGECYVDHLQDASALVGPLPSPWQVQVFKESMDKRGPYRYKNTVTDEVREEDPRLPALSTEWESFADEKGAKPAGALPAYRRKSTGEIVYGDPRLCVDTLRQHNIALERFTLT